jgi:hypothetical protein
MVDDRDPRQNDYLGDGVYSSFDGMHITIRANHHQNPVVAYLEPSVMQNLVDYARRMGMRIK